MLLFLFLKQKKKTKIEVLLSLRNIQFSFLIDFRYEFQIYVIFVSQAHNVFDK